MDKSTTLFELRKDLAQAMVAPVEYMETKFGTDFNGLPEGLRLGYANYWIAGVPPGSFLRAVVCDQFRLAVIKADAVNLANITSIAKWMHNEGDPNCLGKNAAEWMETGGYFGRLRKRVVA